MDTKSKNKQKRQEQLDRTIPKNIVPEPTIDIKQDTTSKTESTKQRRSIRPLTRKEKAFADELIANPKISGSEAAMRTYNASTRESAGVIAVDNLKKPRVLAYLEGHVQGAQETITDIMLHSDSDKLRLDASKEILDRTVGKAVQKHQSTSVNINIDTLLEDLS